MSMSMEEWTRRRYNIRAEVRSKSTTKSLAVAEAQPTL